MTRIGTVENDQFKLQVSLLPLEMLIIQTLIWKPDQPTFSLSAQAPSGASTPPAVTMYGCNQDPVQLDGQVITHQF